LALKYTILVWTVAEVVEKAKKLLAVKSSRGNYFSANEKEGVLARKKKTAGEISANETKPIYTK
jgi:hypothetical protein